MTETAGALDVVLALGALGAAAVALFSRPRIHAAAMFLVFGVLLALVWAWLDAPDVAIAEAVLGAGVTGVLIMNAVTGSPMAAEEHDPEHPGNRLRWYGLTAGLLAVVIALGLLNLMWSWHPAAGLGAAVEEDLAQSGVSHPITAVLLNFRNYDTLLEIAVLAAAAVGALALRPEGTTMPRLRADRGPLGAMVRVLVPILVLAVGWLLVAGSTRPGGAFQAGALLAGALLMLYLAGIGLAQSLQRWLRPILLAGLAVFVLLAAGTAALGNGWLVLEVAWAGTAILVVETVLTASIGATLAVLLIVMDQISSSAPGAGGQDSPAEHPGDQDPQGEHPQQAENPAHYPTGHPTTDAPGPEAGERR